MVLGLHQSVITFMTLEQERWLQSKASKRQSVIAWKRSRAIHERRSSRRLRYDPTILYTQPPFLDLFREAVIGFAHTERGSKLCGKPSIELYDIVLPCVCVSVQPLPLDSPGVPRVHLVEAFNLNICLHVKHRSVD